VENSGYSRCIAYCTKHLSRGSVMDNTRDILEGVISTFTFLVEYLTSRTGGLGSREM
jgi:hypothetical protein